MHSYCCGKMEYKEIVEVLHMNEIEKRKKKVKEDGQQIKKPSEYLLQLIHQLRSSALATPAQQSHKLIE